MISQVSLEKFKASHALWKKCLDGEDRNSVINQIHMMIWNSAVFNVINEARKIAPTDTKGRKELNGMVHTFMDRCFVDSQFLCIRRLVDEEDIYGVKGVFSLVSLLNDMKANHTLITRKNLFLIDGMEYDYKAVQQKELAYGDEQLKRGQSAYFLPNELDSLSIRRRHELIDYLSEANPEDRSPDDAVRPEVFDYLINKIKDTSKGISLYVNKFVAHSASPESREHGNTDDVKITFDHLRDAHKVISQVANFVDVAIISRASHNFLPIPQFNHLKFIDKGIVPSESIEVLSKAWQEFQKGTEEWGMWGIKELQCEMAQAIP